jgi:AcrR family transcriptional regulator
LLDAALACFASRGVFRTGIEDIRRAAGASPSSVYHFFGGLPDVTVALLARTFQRLFGHLATRVDRARGAKASVLALVDGHLEWMLATEHADEGRFLYQAVGLEFDDEARQTLEREKERALEPVVRHLAPFVASGKLPPYRPIELDIVLLGPSHEACRRYLAGASLDPTWMRATLPRIAWRSIRAARTLDTG